MYLADAVTGSREASQAVSLVQPRRLLTPAACNYIQEELSQGQMVLAFSVLADGKSVYNGTAIGRSQVGLAAA